MLLNRVLQLEHKLETVQIENSNLSIELSQRLIAQENNLQSLSITQQKSAIKTKELENQIETIKEENVQLINNVTNNIDDITKIQEKILNVSECLITKDVSYNQDNHWVKNHISIF